MGTEVMKKETSAVAMQSQTPGGEVLSSDVLIPRLLLMQGLSDFVAARKAQMGDMVRSTTAEKLGGPETPIEFIPLTFQNKWMIQELVGKKFEFRKMLPRDHGMEDAKKQETEKTGENLPWDFTQGGTTWRRVKVIECFALLPSDIAAFQEELARAEREGDMPDMNKTLLPVVISFRSTSYTAGRAVVTHFTKAAGMAKYGAKAHGFTLKLSCSQDSNDQGTFYVYDVQSGRRCTPLEFEKASEWFGLLGSSQVVVDEPEEARETAAPARGKMDVGF